MTEEQQLRAELECEKYKVSQLQRENDELKNKLKQVDEERDSLNFKIKQELEPRLKREATCYDACMSCNKAEEACDSFEYFANNLIEMVEDHPEYYSFEDEHGDIIERILWLIKQEIK